ncbi:MAG: heme exporter protein CcmD [Steroidobacteraceae bacterium]
MSEFLAMGGYAAFVWPCFLLTGAVLVWNVIAARWLHAAARNRALRRDDAGKGSC